jgi:AraC-like DNA-binding protein
MYKILTDSVIRNDFENRRGNAVMYSALTRFESKIPTGKFAVKYVMNGWEQYTVRDKQFILNSGDYLLCNAASEGKVLVDNLHQVQGICIDIEQTLMSEVVASLRSPDSSIPDLNLGSFFCTEEFLEQTFNAYQSKLGSLLKKIEHIIQKSPFESHQFELEFYYYLAEAIVDDYIPTVKEFRTLRCIKLSTKRDLFRKLSEGKNFMDNHYCIDIDISEVARQSNISQYHFFRLFRMMYGMSPYQYIRNKRLVKANQLLKTKDMPLAQLAMDIGYSDIYSFSKAYKQFYGAAPSSDRDIKE